jgi:hypothetical protein
MRNGRNDDRFSSHHWLHFDHNGGIDKCGCGFLAEPDDNGWGDSIVEHFATVLRESLSARVTQAETETRERCIEAILENAGPLKPSLGGQPLHAGVWAWQYERATAYGAAIDESVEAIRALSPGTGNEASE